jgi:hypothetical protein
MLNLFQHPSCKLSNMVATCPVGSRNKFGMTYFYFLVSIFPTSFLLISHSLFLFASFQDSTVDLASLLFTKYWLLLASMPGSVAR